MPKVKNLYEVYYKGELIFRGTSAQAEREFDLVNPNLYTYATMGKKLCGKYDVRFCEEATKYEIVDTDGRIVFIGTPQEINEHFNCKTGLYFSQYVYHNTKFKGRYKVRVFVEQVDKSEQFRKRRGLAKLEKDYVWIKDMIERYGNTVYSKKMSDNVLAMLSADGIECYSVPSVFDKKGVVIWRV